MKNFYIGIFDFGFFREGGKISFWFDILRVVSSEEGGDESDEAGAALFSLEKSEDEWLFDLFFIHIW
jgi:hypothetical protein